MEIILCTGESNMCAHDNFPVEIILFILQALQGADVYLTGGADRLLSAGHGSGSATILLACRLLIGSSTESGRKLGNRGRRGRRQSPTVTGAVTDAGFAKRLLLPVTPR